MTGTDLFVFVCQDEQEILAPANILYRNAMITILISTVVLGCIIWLVGHSIIVPVKNTAEANKRLAAKDLTVAFPSIKDPLLRQLSDSSTLLLESFRHLMENLLHTTGTLQGNAQGVSRASERTSNSVETIEAAMEAVRTMTEATSAAIEETNAGIEEVASGAQTASTAAKKRQPGRQSSARERRRGGTRHRTDGPPGTGDGPVFRCGYHLGGRAEHPGFPNRGDRGSHQPRLRTRQIFWP